MKRTALALLLTVTTMFAIAATPAPAFAAPGLTIPVVGSGTSLNPGAVFTGAFNLQRFAVQNGDVVAIGTLTGTVTNAAGQVLGSIVRNVALPVLVGQATCDILHLELGPLDLDLLGLQIHLDKVVLDITAQSGPGNLLGNLLCSVAGLLDQPNALARLLNGILALL